MLVTRDYLVGVNWMCRLDHVSSKVREQAMEHQPTSFSGNTDSFYSCPGHDDRLLLSSNKASKISSILGLENVYNERVPVPQGAPGSRFIRDSSVTLFPRGCLIPYSIKDPLLRNRFLAWLPGSSDLFIFNPKSNGKLSFKALYGKGFDLNNTTSRKRLCYTLHIPFKQARTCIEGGNCFLFLSKGQKKAIIGNHSLFLSVIALEEQGLFDRISPKSIVATPSLESIRTARNLHLYEAKREQEYAKYMKAKKLREEESEKLQEEECEVEYTHSVLISKIESGREKRDCLNEEEEAYRRALIGDVTEEDKTLYWERARLVETKLIVTKQIMAQDLGIDARNIAFIPQTQFHIDMELTVTPEGTVITHDPRLVDEFLKPLRESDLTSETNTALEQYVTTASRHSKKYGSIYDRRIEILKTQALDIERMPALFKAPKSNSCLNYCNGLFMSKGYEVVVSVEGESACAFGKRLLPGSLFVTTGPSNPIETMIHRRFTALFEDTYKEKGYSCVGIEGMSTFVKKYSGGVHCLSLNTSPMVENPL